MPPSRPYHSGGAPVIYEMRRYEAMPGKMPALNEVMETLAVPVFEKVGMRLVGAWTPVAGDYTNALSYMLAWESLNEREEKWQAFFNHPDWLAGREEAGKKHGAVVSREFHTFYGPTSYSPLK